MHVTLRCVTNDGFVVLACRLVGLDIDTECAVEFELQSIHLVSTLLLANPEIGVKQLDLHCSILPGPLHNTAFHTLLFQFHSRRRQSTQILLESLALDFQVTGLFRDLELLGVEAQDVARVVYRIVL
jgi:hypothetical protein